MKPDRFGGATAVYILSFLLAVTGGQAVRAVPLAPGGVYDSLDDPTGVSAVGATLADILSGFSRTESGFAAGEVVDDLWNVSGDLRATASLPATVGGTVFGSRIGVTTSIGPPGGDGLLGYSLSGYAGWEVDVAWRSDLAEGYPFIVSRSPDGDILSFATAGDLLFGGLGGRFFSISTDAPAFRLTGTAAVTTFIAEFGEETVLISGLPAPAPVPLPATLPLALAAFGLMGLFRPRRRA